MNQLQVVHGLGASEIFSLEDVARGEEDILQMNDAEIIRVAARAIDQPESALAGMAVTRTNGNILISPKAVYG